MNKPITDMPHPKMLLDPYAAWAAAEGVPITENFGVDLLGVATAPWRRFGTAGGIVHLRGRGASVPLFVLDLAPSAKARQNTSAAKASSSRCGPAATCGRRTSSPISPASS